MPWTVDDVERHIKGLTDKQKRQWIHIANSVLSRCEIAGESDCEGKAVRQANGTVSKDLTVFKKDLEKQIVYGIVFEPDFIDYQNEFISKEDIEEAAHEYLAVHRQVKLSHQANITNEVDVVESYIAPIEFEMNGKLIKEGTWIVALKIHDKKLWEETEKSIVGLSAGGMKAML